MVKFHGQGLKEELFLYRDENRELTNRELNVAYHTRLMRARFSRTVNTVDDVAIMYDRGYKSSQWSTLQET